MKKIFLLSLVLFAALGLSGCNYNDLTAQQQNVRGKWANIESQLQRRADLIPNIIKTAQMAGVQEQEVFGQIAAAREGMLKAQQAAPPEAKTPEQRQAVIDAANTFGGTVGRLLSLQENYPVLQSNQLFLNAQTELSGTENRINTARTDYNTAVQNYNTGIKQFPGVLTASIFGFKEEPFFQADPASRQAPDIGDPNSMRRSTAPATAPAAPAR
jgi:LemA protein